MLFLGSGSNFKNLLDGLASKIEYLDFCFIICDISSKVEFNFFLILPTLYLVCTTFSGPDSILPFAKVHALKPPFKIKTFLWPNI